MNNPIAVAAVLTVAYYNGVVEGVDDEMTAADYLEADIGNAFDDGELADFLTSEGVPFDLLSVAGTFSSIIDAARSTLNGVLVKVATKMKPIVRFNREWGEWVVTFDDGGTYHTDDEQDARDTAALVG